MPRPTLPGARCGVGPLLTAGRPRVQIIDRSVNSKSCKTAVAGPADCTGKTKVFEDAMASSSSLTTEQRDDARPMTARGEARRTRIMNAAIRLMWRDGFSAVGVDAILKEAGTQKGSFYHFFPSKTDLLLACLDHLWGVQRPQMTKMLEQAPSGRAALASLLDWHCEAQLSAHRRYGYVPGLFHMSVGVAAVHQDDRLGRKFKAFSDESAEILCGILQRIAQEDGLTADPEMLASVIGNYISGMILKARVANDTGPILAITGTVNALMEHFTPKA